MGYFDISSVTSCDVLHFTLISFLDIVLFIWQVNLFSRSFRSISMHCIILLKWKGILVRNECSRTKGSLFWSLLQNLLPSDNKKNWGSYALVVRLEDIWKSYDLPYYFCRHQHHSWKIFIFSVSMYLINQ